MLIKEGLRSPRVVSAMEKANKYIGVIIIAHTAMSTTVKKQVT